MAQVIVVALRKPVQGRLVLRRERPHGPVGQRLQPHARGSPAFGHQHMVPLQLAHQVLQRGVATGQQGREDVEFLVLVVQRGGDVEIAQHVARRLAGGVIAGVRLEVVAQALQQVQRAANAVMAGAQHLERLVKARAWRVQTGQGHTAGHGVSPAARAGRRG